MYTGTKSIMEMHVEETVALRMRKVRPAYRKAMKVINSCQTPEQLFSALRMVDNFFKLFPYAEHFAASLYVVAYDHEFGDEAMKLYQSYVEAD